MAIAQLLAQILAAQYGRDVRQSIHDAIGECYDDVSTAKTLATDATNSANTAATNANEKATLANTKAGLADAAATNANAKATLADTKAGLADAAAINANEKATLANTKAGLADAAAINANEKATLAQEAADLANQVEQPYIHIMYSVNNPTSDGDMISTPSNWIGVYSGPSQTPPTGYTSYEWFKFKGDPGDVTNHIHGNITNDGKIGSSANNPIITGVGGIIQVGSFGTESSTFCEGDDLRLSDERPASDVSPWAKAAEKPTYTPAEVGALALTAMAADSDKLDGLHASEVAFASMVSFSLVGDDLVVTTPTGYTGPTFAIDINGDLIATFSGSSVNIGKVRGYCPYDVGDIYQTTNAANPSTKWAGTAWAALGGRMLIGADGTYPAGSTGGEATHTLTIAELARHGHAISMGTGDGTYFDPYTAVVGNNTGTSVTQAWASGVALEGGGGAHNNMPPYLAVYMWQRTA